MKQMSVDGISIRYVDQGEGAPIVLVHGIPTSSFLWRDVIEKLSNHGRVIAPDLRRARVFRRQDDRGRSQKASSASTNACGRSPCTA